MSRLRILKLKLEKTQKKIGIQSLNKNRKDSPHPNFVSFSWDR